jgi:hypothetical protein
MPMKSIKKSIKPPPYHSFFSQIQHRWIDLIDGNTVDHRRAIEGAVGLSDDTNGWGWSPQQISKALGFVPVHSDPLGKKLGFQYIHELRFENYDALRYAWKRAALFMRKGFVDRESAEIGAKFAAEISRGDVIKGVKVEFIGPHMGYGVVADRVIEPGEFIGEYLGMIRYRGGLMTNPYCFEYPLSIWRENQYLIDAKDVGNLTRMINHSENPNISPFLVYHNGLMHIILIAQEKIYPDQQLFYNYGEEYWK